MKQSEFTEAVQAYLACTANPWQGYLVEDYVQNEEHCFNILDAIPEPKAQEIGDRIFSRIMNSIKAADGK